MTMKNMRDYGMGSSGTPTGKPTWKPATVIGGVEPECPNCGADVCEVKVEVDHPLLKRGKGVSRYLGCPACPWASPAVIVSDASQQEEK